MSSCIGRSERLGQFQIYLQDASAWICEIPMVYGLVISQSEQQRYRNISRQIEQFISYERIEPQHAAKMFSETVDEIEEGPFYVDAALLEKNAQDLLSIASKTPKNAQFTASSLLLPQSILLHRIAQLDKPLREIMGLNDQLARLLIDAGVSGIKWALGSAQQMFGGTMLAVLPSKAFVWQLARRCEEEQTRHMITVRLVKTGASNSLIERVNPRARTIGVARWKRIYTPEERGRNGRPEKLTDQEVATIEDALVSVAEDKGVMEIRCGASLLINIAERSGISVRNIEQYVEDLFVEHEIDPITKVLLYRVGKGLGIETKNSKHADVA